MTAPRRGEVWLADLGDPVGREQGHRRPIVVTSVDEFNELSRGLVLVVPTTSRERRWPTHVELPAQACGLDRPSFAKVEDLRSISTRRLTRRLGAVPRPVMDDLARIARLLLGL